MVLRADGSGSDIAVSHSHDNGLTWSDPVIAIAGTEGANLADKPWIATARNFPAPKGSADNDRVYVVSMIFSGEAPETPRKIRLAIVRLFL